MTVRLRRLASLLGPYRVQVLAGALAVLVATAAALVPPYLAGLAVDQVIQSRDTALLDDIVIAIAIALAVGWAAGWAQTYLIGWVGQRVLRDLRVQLFSHLQRLSLAFYERQNPGTLISRLSNNIEQLDQLVSNGLNALLSGALVILGTAIVLLVLDLELALLIFAVFPLLFAGTWVYRRISQPAFAASMSRIGEVTDSLEETLTGARVIRTFSQEDRHRSEFAAINQRNREASFRTVRQAGVYLPGVVFVSTGVIGVLLAFGGFQVVDGTEQLGVLVSFIAYLRLALSPVPDLAALFTTYAQGAAALDQIFELLEEEPEIKDRPGLGPLPPARGEVEFEAVTFGYGEDHVLHDVNLRVESGRMVAIIGPTGAGKSTLIKLLMRLYEPQQGRILIDGHDIRDVTLDSLRGQMGVVLQESVMFAGSVRDNIAFGRPGASDDEVERAAAAVGVLDALSALPAGLDTQVGEAGTSLSSGQRALIALARASMVDPRILILDEATASLDLGSEERVHSALELLLGGRTSFVVAHRLSTVRRADLIVVVADGRIAETGSHSDLLEAGGVYADLYRDNAG